MSTNMTKEQLQAMTQVVSRQTFNNKVTEAIVGFIGGNLQPSYKIVVNKYYPGDDGVITIAHEGGKKYSFSPPYVCFTKMVDGVW